MLFSPVTHFMLDVRNDHTMAEVGASLNYCATFQGCRGLIWSVCMLNCRFFSASEASHCTISDDHNLITFFRLPANRPVTYWHGAVSSLLSLSLSLSLANYIPHIISRTVSPIITIFSVCVRHMCLMKPIDFRCDRISQRAPMIPSSGD